MAVTTISSNSAVLVIFSTGEIVKVGVVSPVSSQQTNLKPGCGVAVKDLELLNATVALGVTVPPILSLYSVVLAYLPLTLVVIV